jgi:hypothetical protein
MFKKFTSILNKSSFFLSNAVLMTMRAAFHCMASLGMIKVHRKTW